MLYTLLYSTTFPLKVICTIRKCMKIKVVLRIGNTYKNGEAPLMLRFTHQRQTRFVALGISIREEFWDEEKEMVTHNHPQRSELQSKIESIKSGYIKRIAKLEALEMPVTFESVIDNRKQSVRLTIREAFELEINRLATLGKFKTRDKYKGDLEDSIIDAIINFIKSHLYGFILTDDPCTNNAFSKEVIAFCSQV